MAGRRVGASQCTLRPMPCTTVPPLLAAAQAVQRQAERPEGAYRWPAATGWSLAYQRAAKCKTEARVSNSYGLAAAPRRVRTQSTFQFQEQAGQAAVVVAQMHRPAVPWQTFAAELVAALLFAQVPYCRAEPADQAR